MVRAIQALMALGMAMVAMAIGAPAAGAIPVVDYCGEQCVPNRCEAALQAKGTYTPGYACNTSVASLSYYKGWANVRTDLCGDLMVAAWAWNGSSWSKKWHPGGTRVYVWPFSTGWSWVWTQAAGWRAMRDANLIVNKWTDPLMPMPGCAYMGTQYVD